MNDNVIRCVWEHNGNDTLLYAVDYVGAYTRGETKKIAVSKMADEIRSYCLWAGFTAPENINIEIVQEKVSTLNICDADSDVLFDNEKPPLAREEYDALKNLALKSANDFLLLYNSIPKKAENIVAKRKTFYGEIPASPLEMLQHTQSVNSYYFAEIDIAADNDNSIFDCRARGFLALENTESFLENKIFDGSYGELWSLRKLLRRFIWHDRIHAKALWRASAKKYGTENILNPFNFKG